jgi:hypothetical protein
MASWAAVVSCLPPFLSSPLPRLASGDAGAGERKMWGWTHGVLDGESRDGLIQVF